MRFDIKPSQAGRDANGWAHEIGKPGLNSADYEAEATALFDRLILGQTGATFRLPLRTELDVDGGLGPAMAGDAAAALLQTWADSLRDGRLLLFLSSVERVCVQQWDHGAAEPTIIAQVAKCSEGVAPFPRLPSTLPEDATLTFKTLKAYLCGLTDEDRRVLSEQHSATVRIEVSGGDVTPTAAVWRVVQRFDAESHELLQLMEGCAAIPTVGVAIPMLDKPDEPPRDDGVQRAEYDYAAADETEVSLTGGDHVANVTEVEDGWVKGTNVTTGKTGKVPSNYIAPCKYPNGPSSHGATHTESANGGGVFCFLPVGAIRTKLPVHLNASFQVTKDRRSLLWKTGGDTLDGKHAEWAKWNEVLLSSVLPTLWLDAIVEMTAEISPRAAYSVLQCLPDLRPTHINPSWAPCADALYRLASTAAILPHLHGETAEWVRPDQAGVLEKAPTAAFEGLRGLLMELHSKTAPVYDHPIVHLPGHIAAACRAHCGITDVSTPSLIERLLDTVHPVHQLTPTLVALAEYADRPEWEVAETERWGTLLAKHPWVPLLNHPHASSPTIDSPGIRYANASNAFAPDAKLLVNAKLMVVQTATAAVDGAAVLRTLKRWGLKEQLTWSDAVQEAAQITEITHATGFLRYLDDHADKISENDGGVFSGRQVDIAENGDLANAKEGLTCVAAVAKLSTFAIVPGWSPAGIAEEKRPALHRVADLCHQKDFSVVWAVLPSAQGSFPRLAKVGFGMKQVVSSDLADQIERLSLWVAQKSGDSDGEDGAPRWSATKAERHLRAAAHRILREPAPQAALERLRAIAWLPSDVLDGTTRLLTPSRVALRLEHDLFPQFGELNNVWQKGVLSGVKDHGGYLAAAGMSIRLPVAVLADALAMLAAKLNDPDVESPPTKHIVNLVNELALQWCARTGQAAPHVLTACGRLELASRVFINDAPWSSSSEDKPFLLHANISTDVGDTLGCTSVRAELARASEAGDESDDLGEEFGQREELSTRIRGLLREYDDPFDVFTEHWQNSDDAGADALFFMLDHSEYPTDRLVSDRCDELQGPALVLASNKSLSTDDIKRIQQLGNSQKRGQFEQAGQFGVGLSCLYRFADCPMLLANGALHVMDPLQITVATGSDTGKKYSMDRLKANQLDDMLAPFQCPELECYQTVFRLPLRQSGTIRSDRFARSIPAVEIELTLKTFAADAQELLLFSKCVRKVEFAVKQVRGEVDVFTSATLQLADRAAAELVMTGLPTTLETVQALVRTPRRQVDRVNIQTVVGDGAGERTQNDQWVIAHALEADADLFELVKIQHDSGAAMLPHGAAAIRLGSESTQLSGRVCCYLPLAAMQLGLPLVLHGCFRPASNRKSIPCDGSDAKCRWNTALLQGPVASSLALLAETCCPHVDDGAISLSAWFALLTLEDTSGNRSTSQLRNTIVRPALLPMLYLKRVFPVVTKGTDVDGGGVQQWQDGPSVVLRAPGNQLLPVTQDQLVVSGLPLVHLPEQLTKRAWSAAGETLSVLDPNRLHDFLITCKTMPALESVVPLVKFILRGGPTNDAADPNSGARLLHGTPLLISSDAAQGWFGKTECFWDHAKLLPNKGKFIDPILRKEMITFLGSTLKTLHSGLKAAGIKLFTPSIFQRHWDEVKLAGCHKDTEWRRHALDFILKGKTVEVELRRVLADFAEWPLVLVTPPTRAKEACWPLKDLCTVFSLAKIDSDYQEEIGAVVLGCGVPVLHSSQPDNDLIKLVVASSDADLLRRISQQVQTQRNSLDTKATVTLLEYFSSKSSKKLPEERLSDLRKLPLFLSAVEGEGYCTLGDPAVDVYLCVHEDARLGQLKKLKVHSNVRFLALPPRDCALLFERLGVRTLSAEQYVEEFVCNALEPASVAAHENPASAKLLNDLLGEVEVWVLSDTPSLTIKEAARVKKCVLSATKTFCRPDDLVDPAHPLVAEFASEAASWTRSSRWKARSDLLEVLGQRTHPSHSEIAALARVVDAAGRQEGTINAQTQQRSFQLVEEVCRQLRGYESNADDVEALLTAIEGLNIALVTPTGHDAVKACLMPRPPKQQLMLVPLRGLCLTPLCKMLAGWRFPSLARDAGKPKSINLIDTHLSAVTNEHADVVNDHLGCLCRQTHVPLIVIAEQLELATTVIAENRKTLDFARGGPVYIHMCALLDAANTALAPMKTGKTPCDKSVRDVFARLQQQSCIPLATLTDAGGELPPDMSPIQMVKPTQCFVHLPATARVQSKLPMYELNRTSALWPPVARWPHLHPVLGVRESPTMSDWADCTRIIDQNVNKTAINDGADPVVALPSELAAIRVAIEEMLRCDTSSNDAIAVWLPDSKGRVVPASSLVWLDRPEFTDRCTSVSFVVSDLLGSNASWFDLCSKTNLSKLSETIVETLTTRNHVEPTESELCLEELLRSGEFAEGYAQLVQGDGGVSERASAELELRVHQVLKTIDVQWSSKIETCLKLKGDIDDVSDDDEATSTQKNVFCDGDGRLWLQSGHLESSGADALLSELGGNVLPKIVLAFADAVQQTHVVVNMLKAWMKGPAEIANVLSKEGIAKGRRGGMREMMRPGRIIPADRHETVKGRFYLPLQPGDVVAVCMDAASTTAYKYAKVEQNQEAVRVAAGLKPNARNGNGDNVLTRVYMLDEGESAPVERKRLEIFNITRDDNVSSAAPVDGSVVPASGSAAAREAPEAMTSEEWKDLIKQLRDMVDLSGKDYRRVLKQLWLLWHPDRNKRECSAAVFRLVTRHSQCFKSDGRDFAWLDQLSGPETLDAAAQAAQPTTSAEQAQTRPASPHVPQPSYFAEFEREEAAHAAAQKKEEVRRNTANSMWQGDGNNNGATSDADPRVLDDGMADRYWILAERELVVADVLKKAKLWAPSVVHAQQAVELAVKSLMFRECGITTFELKGVGAHDLVTLLRRLLPDQSTWPADSDAVHALSKSYIEARYGPTAVSGFAEPEAEQARLTARSVVEWAKQKDWVPTPTTDGGVADRSLPPQAKKSVVFDPVPPPSPPSQPSIDTAKLSVELPPPPSFASVEPAATVHRVALPDAQLELE